MEIIYGTGNHAKILFMERALKGLPVEISSISQVAAARKIALPWLEETGSTPLENARIKAEAYYKLLGSPVFSCDSGLYLWNHETGQPLPKEEQPGVCVRGRMEKRRSDDDLLAIYTGLVRKYGLIRARYMNAICLIWNEEIRAESMEEDLWGEEFLLTDKPHPKRVEGFPIDSISIDIRTGKYYYDIKDNSQDTLAGNKGFYRFFNCFLEQLSDKR